MALLLVLPASSAAQSNPGRWTLFPLFAKVTPEARWQHVAVWTGSRMIVWGGGSATGEPNTGGLYDPSTRRWTPMSTAGALSCYQPEGVWTGSKMIVWGALDYDWSESGQVYDPATDTWTRTTTIEAPTSRASHTAVWTGSSMIVWGGWDGDATDTGGIYDPATDSWKPTSTDDVPTPRQDHTAVWTGSRMIVWGGFRWGPGYTAIRTNTGALYDPATDTWTSMNTVGAPTARDGHAAVWTGSSMIVWGGWDGSRANTGALYDPATNTWTPMSTVGAPTGRLDFTTVWTGSKMIVWGGWDGAATSTGGIYDPLTDTWTATSTVGTPTARETHSAVWTGSKMIVWGGIDDGGAHLDTGGVFDPYAKAAPPARPSGPVVTTGSGRSSPRAGDAWTVERIADFDRDGRPDRLWRHRRTGRLYMQYGGRTTRSAPR